MGSIALIVFLFQYPLVMTDLNRDCQLINYEQLFQVSRSGIGPSWTRAICLARGYCACRNAKQHLNRSFRISQ